MEIIDNFDCCRLALVTPSVQAYHERLPSREFLMCKNDKNAS